MNCKEAEELISSYIDDNLENRYLSDFLSHIKKCSQCRDELEVRFLVKEGLIQLEAGEAFNLKNELDRKLLRSKRVIDISLRVRAALIITAVIIGLIIIGVILGVIIM